MYCKKCGKELSDDSNFCKYCGAKQDDVLCEELSKKDIPNITAPLSQDIINRSQDVKNECCFDTAGSHYTSTIAFKNEKSNCKRKKIIRWVSFLAVIIILVVVFFIQQNTFGTDVDLEDLIYEYSDSNGTQIISTIIPQCDIENLSLRITYRATKGLLNSYEQQYNLGNVKKDQPVIITESLDFVQKQINGTFDSAYYFAVEGKKQNKYATKNKLEPLPAECDFSFILECYDSYFGSSNFLDITITNNTDKYIAELREFSVTIDFGDKSCKYYRPRIILPEKLAPNATIKVEDLTGNFTLMDFYDAEQNSPYYSNKYGESTYQVIYAN